MPRYETLILTIPHITTDEARDLEKAYEAVVKKHNGTFLTFDRWGKYRLAYPVRKNDYGIYYLARIEVDNAAQPGILEDLYAVLALKQGSIVMRHMNTKLQEGQALEYQRPESLEDTPTRDVGQFLRDNKMESLLPAVEGKGRRSEGVSLDVDEDEIDG
jgi:small subunit ribosomal protein S6